MDTNFELDDNSLSIDLNADPMHNSFNARKIEFEGGVLDESKSSLKEKPDLLIDQLNRMRSENKKLTEMLVIVCENYNALQGNLMDLMQKYSGDELTTTSRKRKLSTENSVSTLGNDGNNERTCDQGSPTRPKEIRTNVSSVYVRTDPADTSLVVKDGYHWRKYGQKVTKDNPSPRAYYKCSFAPTCQVKKKVQRSVGDPSILVATYEGEHNHQHPMRAEFLMASTLGSAAAALSPVSNSCEFSGPPRTPDLSHDFIDHGLCNNKIRRTFSKIETNAIEEFMVEKMASSLTRNPNFTAALVAAISGRILSHDPAEK